MSGGFTNPLLNIEDINSLMQKELNWSIQEVLYFQESDLLLDNSFFELRINKTITYFFINYVIMISN